MFCFLLIEVFFLMCLTKQLQDGARRASPRPARPGDPDQTAPRRWPKSLPAPGDPHVPPVAQIPADLGETAGPAQLPSGNASRGAPN